MKLEAILKTENLWKSFKSGSEDKLTVLKDISIEIPKGKISVIMGASGAGKSTLLHLLGGLDSADKGRVIFENLDVLSMNQQQSADYRNTKIGFVFQFHHLLPEFSALENIMIPVLIKGEKKTVAQKRGNELLELVGLIKRANHKPAQLSGGEQQRIAVARALANDPNMLLADEPTGNLDSVNSEMLNDLFVRLRDELGKTFIIVTHNSELMKLADNLFEMKDGTIIIRR